MPAGDPINRHYDRRLFAQSTADDEALGATAEGSLHIDDHLGITSVVDAAANDSDKLFTVPAGEVWQLIAAYAQIVTTATPGGREILIEIRDTADLVVAGSTFWASIPANTTATTYWVTGGVNVTAPFRNTGIMPLPARLWIPAGYDIHVYDAAAIAAAADDLTVALLYRALTP